MIQINWKRFPKIYDRVRTHWYVSKTKEYTLETLDQMQSGFGLLHQWFVDSETLKKSDKEFLQQFLKTAQYSFKFVRGGNPIWDRRTQLLFTYILDQHSVISDKNQTEPIRQKYREVFERIEHGWSYEKLEKRYDARLLNDISANARNFISLYKKLGLAWVNEGKAVSITSTGEKFLDTRLDKRVVIEKQLIKWQLYNPTVPRSRYKDLQVFPFLFLLDLLLQIDPPELTKDEYALFVTKAQRMSDIDDVKVRISEFRGLTDKEKSSVIDSVQGGSTRKRRPLLEEILDSAGKEIGFFTLAGPLEETRIGRAYGIKLVDRDRAKEILGEKRPIVFIDFKEELDWVGYYGDWRKGPTVDDAIEYYADIGEIRKAKEIITPQSTKKQKDKLARTLEEKDIETYYRDRLDLLEPRLVLYQESGRDGQQYPTEVGRIDLLTIANKGKGEFVVIEFKKDQGADETVGQILRYIGWTKVNLAKGGDVRGIIIAREIDESLKYAITAIASLYKDFIIVKRHQFGVTSIEMNISKRKK